MRRVDVAVIILYNKEKRVLLQHRTDDAPICAGYWGLFGGGIEKGETPGEALQREIEEEIEYQVKDAKLIMAENYKVNGQCGKKYIFLVKYDGAKLCQHEGQGMGWFKVNEINGLLMEEQNRKAIELAVTHFM